MTVREPTSKSGRILVIDDDEIALQAICDLLERGGYDVHPLASPIGATQVIATQGVVAAVIDLNMPVMSGDRFIALVRSWDKIRDVPVVLISGESSSTVREAAAQLSGVAVVTKAQMSELLVPTLDYSLAARGPVTSSRPSMAALRAEPAVSMAQQQLAQSCLSAWREFAATRTVPLQKLVDTFVRLHAESHKNGLGNTVQLVAAALEVVELCGGKRQIVAEADMSMTEVLSLLASVEADKSRIFDRSLALTIHRSRLDRARQLMR